MQISCLSFFYLLERSSRLRPLGDADQRTLLHEVLKYHLFLYRYRQSSLRLVALTLTVVVKQLFAFRAGSLWE